MGYITGRYTSKKSTLSEAEIAEQKMAYTRMLADMDVQEAKLQQQSLSTFGAIAGEEARLNQVVLDSVVKVIQANASMRPAALAFYANVNKRASELAAENAWMVGDAAAEKNLKGQLSGLVTLTDATGAANALAEPGNTPTGVYMRFIGDDLPMDSIAAYYSPLEIPDEGKQFISMRKGEAALLTNIAAQIRTHQRSHGGTMGEMEIQAAAQAIFNEKVEPRLTGSLSPGAEERAGDTASAGAKQMDHYREVYEGMRSLGIPQSEIDRVRKSAEKIGKMTEGGPAAFMKLAADMPTSSFYDERRKQLMEERALVGVAQDPLIESVRGLMAVPGVRTWASAMGFKNDLAATRWARNHQEEFLAQLAVALDPDLDIEEYKAQLKTDRDAAAAEEQMIQEKMSAISTTRRGRRLGTKGERDGILRKLIGGLFGKKEDEGREDIPLDDKDLDAIPDVEGITSEVSTGAIENGVVVIEGGYKHEIYNDGSIYTTKLPDGERILVPPGSGPYNAIVEVSTKELSKEGINLQVPPAAVEAMETPQGQELTAEEYAQFQAAVGATPAAEPGEEPTVEPDEGAASAVAEPGVSEQKPGEIEASIEAADREKRAALVSEPTPEFDEVSEQEPGEIEASIKYAEAKEEAEREARAAGVSEPTKEERVQIEGTGESLSMPEDTVEDVQAKLDQLLKQSQTVGGGTRGGDVQKERHRLEQRKEELRLGTSEQPKVAETAAVVGEKKGGQVAGRTLTDSLEALKTNAGRYGSSDI